MKALTASHKNALGCLQGPVISCLEQGMVYTAALHRGTVPSLVAREHEGHHFKVPKLP